MTDNRLLRLLATGAALTLAIAPAAMAQRQPPSPEQRLDRLERQVSQMQRQVFPRGRPADTAGFADDPAASQSAVASLAQRLDSLERQMADLLRQNEENGNLLRSLQSDFAKARSDSEERLGALERGLSALQSAAPVGDAQASAPAAPTVARPSPMKPTPAKPAPAKPAKPKPGATAAAADADSGLAPGAIGDAGEEAYTIGFKQWQAGDLGAAIRSLKAFTAAYPTHRRVSYANNLIGRALIDQGNLIGAAEVLLANYRKNPRGERAPDSLYYLGQAEMKLGQPGQACKAYAEIDAVYGAKLRADLARLVESAKSEAKC